MKEPIPANVQRLIDDLYFLFTHDSAEIAAQFGESRCVDDSCRINYALEWLEGYVSETPDEPTPASAAVGEAPE